MPLSGTGTEALVTTPEAEYAANISPNGRFFAYESFETGRSEILIRPYPDAGSPEEIHAQGRLLIDELK